MSDNFLDPVEKKIASVLAVKRLGDVLDTPAANMPDDMLEHLFVLQAELGRRVGLDSETTSEEVRSGRVLNYTRALQQEVAELVDCFPWKWWAHYQHLDLQNARVEVVDILHFLISIAQTLGMTARDLHDAFVKKNAVNLQRQISGYTAKNPNDSRHI